MADAVLHDIPDTMAGATEALTRHSLLDLDGDHYRMLVTTRDVARRQLLAHPDLYAAAMTALFTWSRTRTQDPVVGSNLTADEVHALQAGLDWALRHDLPGGGEVMDRLARWELTRTRSASTLELATRVLAGPDPVTPDEVVLQVSAIRLCAGLASSQPVPLDKIDRIVAYARTLDDVDVRVKAMRMQAAMLDRAGHHDKASLVLQETVELDDLPDADRALMRIDLGVSRHLNGDLEQAEEHYRRGVEEIDPEDVNHAIIVANLGEVLLDAGRWGDAAEVLRRVVREAIGRPNLRAWATALLVEAEARRGNREIADALAEQAEADLALVIETDPSLASVLDRMHAALESLDGENADR